MKKLYVIMFTILGLSCSKEEKFIELQREEFVVLYPPSLILDESHDNGTIFILRTNEENDNDTFIENINLVKADAANLSFDDLAAKTIRDIETIAKPLEVSRIKVNDSDCLRVIFELSNSNKNMKVLQHFFVKKEKVYILTFTSEAEKFKQYFDDMNSVFMSFELK